MKLKLDENFDVRIVPQLAAEGFDADTVGHEGLAGSPDEAIHGTCKAVGRTLVTLDLDFSNPLHFPPARYGAGSDAPPLTDPGPALRPRRVNRSLAEALVGAEQTSTPPDLLSWRSGAVSIS